MVNQSLKERAIWQRIAPRHVSPIPFLFPTSKNVMSRLFYRLGLGLYDMLSFGQTMRDHNGNALPFHWALNNNDSRAAVPALMGSRFRGAYVYFDGLNLAPERIILEILIDAQDHGAISANYVKAMGYQFDDDTISGARGEDSLTQETLAIRATHVVNATGAWTNQMLDLAAVRDKKMNITLSKGIHILTRPFTGDYALTLADDKKHLFCIPWKSMTLIGTTDTIFEGDPDSLKVNEKEVETMLDRVNNLLPDVNLSIKDVFHAYAGLRSLASAGDDSYRMSRKAMIFDHCKHSRIRGLYSIIGGKWTTARLVAQNVIDLIVHKGGYRLRNCDTMTTELPFEHRGNRSEEALMHMSLCQNYPKASHAIVNHLIGCYGTKAEKILNRGSRDYELLKPICPDKTVIGAEVLHAVEEESALQLADVVCRRTFLGTSGHPGNEALLQTASIMASKLGWSDDQKIEQITKTQNAFPTFLDKKTEC